MIIDKLTDLLKKQQTDESLLNKIDIFRMPFTLSADGNV